MEEKKVPFVSIIIPTKNCASELKRCLLSLNNLNYPKNYLEIIIVDGFSTDGSKEVALEFNTKVILNEKQVVVSARNLGFREARGELVVYTDADCIFDSYWIKNSLKYFRDEKVGGVGGVVVLPQKTSYFEQAVDFLFYIADLFSLTAHRQRKKISSFEVKDIPGCNAIYRYEVLKKILPIDEDLLTGDDVWLNFCIRKLGYRLIFAPDVIVWHYRRDTPKKFIRQIYRYAIGRLQLAKKDLSLLNPLHLFIGLGLIIFVFIYLLGLSSFLLKITIFLFIFLIIFSFLKLRSVSALYVPWVFVLFILSWSIGFIKELFFPLKDIRGK